MSSTSDAFLFEQIAESIRLQIARGELKPGDRLPSIRAAARRWNCTPSTVSRAYSVLADEDLISSHRGGGTHVTENRLTHGGRPLHSALLINQIEALFLSLLGQGYSQSQVEGAFAAALTRWHTLQQTSELPGGTQPGHLRFVGSHDLALEHLAAELNKRGDYQLSLAFRGSLGGLMALARGEADVAGSHLWDEETASYNVAYVRRVLPGQRVALVTVGGRSFGLMTHPDQPQPVRRLEDLASGTVRWVNRQPGSGTRVWLDGQLRHHGIKSITIPGYDDIRATHSEVAEAIWTRAAEAGIGIKAAAQAYDLDFIPLSEELYQLIIPEHVFRTDACQILVSIVQSDSFGAALQELGGYQTTATGEIIWLE